MCFGGGGLLQFSTFHFLPFFELLTCLMYEEKNTAVLLLVSFIFYFLSRPDYPRG